MRKMIMQQKQMKDGDGYLDCKNLRKRNFRCVVELKLLWWVTRITNTFPSLKGLYKKIKIYYSLPVFLDFKFYNQL